MPNDHPSKPRTRSMRASRRSVRPFNPSGRAAKPAFQTAILGQGRLRADQVRPSIALLPGSGTAVGNRPSWPVLLRPRRNVRRACMKEGESFSIWTLIVVPSVDTV